MKLTIEKVRNGIKFTLERPNAAPASLVLAIGEAEGLVAIIQAAVRSDVFKFILESEGR